MKAHRTLIVLAVLVALVGALPAGADPRADVPAILGDGAEKVEDSHYRIRFPDGLELYTHGPDPVPDHGYGIGPGDPERAPVCATDYYQHVLYGRLSGSTDRYASVKATIQASMRRINHVLNEESLATGNKTADYKVKCDASGAIQVDSFTAPGAGYYDVVDAARAAGFSASNADYSIFFDSQPAGVCGVGSYYRDERASASNRNNDGGGYAITYNQCWTGATPMHENGHNQGAVQYNAPYSTGSGGHCIDEEDVMCYSPDGGDRNQGGTILRCADRLYFDCGNDTYFDSEPEAGEYLANAWNIGSSVNRFIAFGQPLDGPPTASFAISCADYSCTFTDTSTDGGTIVSRSWAFGDGATSTQQHPTHTYAAAGTYTVTLTVTDDDANSASASQAVTVPNTGDPDPATPTLYSGVPRSEVSGPAGTWRYYKISVPPGRGALNVVLDGPACLLIVACNPDLDLYVKLGARPATNSYSCRSIRISNDEACTIGSPTPGYWYLGVYTYFSVAASAGYTITATY